MTRTSRSRGGRDWRVSALTWLALVSLAAAVIVAAAFLAGLAVGVAAEAFDLARAVL